MLFKKKEKLSSVANGTLIPLSEVNDEVFSSGVLGPGFCIKDHSGEVYSPADGKILNIFPTKHAITLELINGQSVLIHMGIDTVELKGLPFKLFVKEDDLISSGDKIAEMDLNVLKENNVDSSIMVVLPDYSAGKILNPIRKVSKSEVVFKL